MHNYKEMAQIDCSEFIEKKGNLSYISWASAWHILCEKYPDASYEHHDWVERPNGEMMVFCTVTVGNKSLKAHLPVLDHRNNPVKNPNVFQINTSMQRCFAKAISMHGLGLYVYRGEDLPPEDEVDHYNEAIDRIDDPMAFHEYVHNLDEELQSLAFNGAPKGEKSKFKEKWRITIADANKQFDEYVDFLREGVEEQDANKVYDLVSDFTPYESSIVWDRLTESQKQNLEKLLESIDE